MGLEPGAWVGLATPPALTDAAGVPLPFQYWRDDMILVVLPKMEHPSIISGNAAGTNDLWQPGGYAGSAGHFENPEASAWGSDLRMSRAKFYKIFEDGRFTYNFKNMIEHKYSALGFLAKEVPVKKEKKISGYYADVNRIRKARGLPLLVG